MLRRVHSFWNHVARLICPELIPDNPRMFNQGEKETWLSDFHREQELVQHRTRERREGPQLAFANIARNVFDDIRSYPANLNILIDALLLLNGSIPLSSDEDIRDTESSVGNTHYNTLYSTLSRHVLRPNPYAAQDLEGQCQEQIEATPRSNKVLVLGSNILAALIQFPRFCPQHIQTLLDSLYVLTSARPPKEKNEEDWQFTLKTAQILRVTLHKSECMDIETLGIKGEESLLAFVSNCLILYDRSEPIDQPFMAWLDIRDELTLYIYGIIRNLLRLQIPPRHEIEETLYTNTALSLTDSTQSDKLVLYFLSFLHRMPNLDEGRNGSSFDGVILKILRSRWDTNCLNPGVWARRRSSQTGGIHPTHPACDGSNDPLCVPVRPGPLAERER